MIALHMNRTDYENDIRALLMAFFYGEKIVLDAVEWTQRLEVCYEDNKVMAELTDREGKCETGSVACDFADYKETRNRIKRMVYSVLSAYTGQTLPWGTLTGIRPTKLPMELFENGAADEETISYLKEKYLVSDKKAALCAEVARNEEAVLKGIEYGNTFSLYVGIPFCPSICAYCSFSSYPLAVWEKEVDTYLDALEKEIEASASMMGEKKLLTFYMGGGTPTS